MRGVAGKVQHGARDHDVGAGLGERRVFNGFHAKIRFRCQRAHLRNRVRVQVVPEHIEPLAQQVDEVASATAAGVEHPPARGDAAAQQLVEEVDVDVAEFGHIRTPD